MHGRQYCAAGTLSGICQAQTYCHTTCAAVLLTDNGTTGTRNTRGMGVWRLLCKERYGPGPRRITVTSNALQHVLLPVHYSASQAHLHSSTDSMGQQGTSATKVQGMVNK